MSRTLVLAAFLVFAPSSLPANPAAVSFDVFYSSLAPHGEWIQCDGGVYAWRPVSVGAGWRPYYNGRWCWTDDGWYWASDEPWSWATYHYGRWYNDDFYGWVWIPGYDWAPAWVEWRYGGDYVGWAPLSPYAVFSLNFGIHYRSYWITPHSWWSFVDCRYISDPYIHKYVYRPENNTRFIGRTRSAGSVRYDGGRIITRGPERDYVERRGNIRLERAEIHDVSDRSVDRIVRDGGRERVEVYRPTINERAVDAKDIRPDNVRGADHRISLDTKGIDARSRDVDRESGRDIHRAEEFRKRENSQIQKGSVRQGQGEIERRRQRDTDRGGNGTPTYDRGHRKDDKREASRPPSPELKSRRGESRGVDRAPAHHSQPQRSGSGRESGSRDDGRKR